MNDSQIAVTEQEIRDASILIVDDQEVNVTLLERMLRREGYHDIRSLTDSRLVDETFLEFQPDILLLDIRMPHIDGFGVMENLAKLPGSEYLPIIVITGEGERSVRHQALASGARDFLEKPLDRSETMARIKNTSKSGSSTLACSSTTKRSMSRCANEPRSFRNRRSRSLLAS